MEENLTSHLSHVVQMIPLSVSRTYQVQVDGAAKRTYVHSLGPPFTVKNVMSLGPNLVAVTLLHKIFVGSYAIAIVM